MSFNLNNNPIDEHANIFPCVCCRKLFNDYPPPQDLMKVEGYPDCGVDANKHKINLGNAKTEPPVSHFVLSPSTSTRAHETVSLPIQTFSSSKDVAFPSAPTLFLGSNQVFLNSGEFPICFQTAPFPDAPIIAMVDSHPGLSSEQAGLSNSSFVPILPTGLSQFLGQCRVSLSEKTFAYARKKRSLLGAIPEDAPMENAPKRPKESEMSIKMGLGCKDVEVSLSELGISSNTEDEGQGDIDLTLHL